MIVDRDHPRIGTCRECNRSATVYPVTLPLVALPTWLCSSCITHRT